METKPIEKYEFIKTIRKSSGELFHIVFDGIMYGISNDKGNFVYPCKYDNYACYPNGLISLWSADDRTVTPKVIVVNILGEIVDSIKYPFSECNDSVCLLSKYKYENLRDDVYNNLAQPTLNVEGNDYETFSISYKNEKHNFTLVGYTYIFSCLIDNELHFCLSKEGKCVFIDEDGIIVKETGWEYVSQFNERGEAVFETERGKGMINKSFNVILPDDFIEVINYDSEWKVVRRPFDEEKRYDESILSLINIDNQEEMCISEYIICSNLSDGRFLVLHPENGYGYLDTRGEEVIKCKYHDANDFDDGTALVRFDAEYGFINKDGQLIVNNGNKKWTIPSCYDWGFDYENGFAKVQKGNFFGIIDEKGNEIIPCKYHGIIQEDEDTFIVERRHYKYGCLTGHVNTNGFFVFILNGVKRECKNKYDWLFPFSEGLARFVYEDYCGFINSNGEEIIRLPKNQVAGDFMNGLALITNYSKNDDDSYGKKYFINKRGNIVINGCSRFDDLKPFVNGLAWYKIETAYRGVYYGFIDTFGRMIVQCRFAERLNNSMHLIKVGIDGIEKGTIKFGVTNMSDIVIPIEYDNIDYSTTNPSYIICRKDGIFDIYNLDGVMVMSTKYFENILFDNLFVISNDYNENDSKKLVSVNGKTLLSKCSNIYCHHDSNYVIAHKDNTLKIYSRRGKHILDLNGNPRLDFVNDVVIVNQYYYSDYDKTNRNVEIIDLKSLKSKMSSTFTKTELDRLRKVLRKEKDLFLSLDINHKYGYNDKNGRKVIPNIFDEALAFENGLASVKSNGLWGVIDMIGQFVIPCYYENPISFVDGLAVIKENGKLGFITSSGKQLVSCIYDEVHDFSEGYAAVRKDKKWGYIDRKGKVVIGFKYKEARDFHSGLALVEGFWPEYNSKFINKKDKVIIQLNFHHYNVSDFDGEFASSDYKVCVPGKDDTYVTIKKGKRSHFFDDPLKILDEVDLSIYKP